MINPELIALAKLAKLNLVRRDITLTHEGVKSAHNVLALYREEECIFLSKTDDFMRQELMKYQPQPETDLNAASTGHA